MGANGSNNKAQKVCDTTRQRAVTFNQCERSHIGDLYQKPRHPVLAVVGCGTIALKLCRIIRKDIEGDD
jgi:hypothetical protein